MKNEIHIIHWTKIIWVPVSRMPYWNVVKYTRKIEQFIGAGIYAIYYVGDHQPYQRLGVNEIPIYVGKAVPQALERAISA